MAVNPYFNKFKNLPEQNLVESLIIENIKIHGMEMYYIPRTMLNRDDLFGEAAYSRFESFKMIEMYMDTTNSFEGGDMFTKFGLEIRDSAKFSCSKKRFKRETGMDRPMEGDLLYLPLNRSLFEVKFVEHENPFYKLGKLYVYQITVEKFQFSEEEFMTGVPEIDVVTDDAAYKLDITIGATSGTGSFAKGDLVYQWSNGSVTGGISGAAAKATVFSYNANTPSSIVVVDTYGSWQVTGSAGQTLYITKSDNSAYRTVTGIADKFGTLIDHQNVQIETEADTILDFSERHPFGDP
jgi:hypothetical protein